MKVSVSSVYPKLVIQLQCENEAEKSILRALEGLKLTACNFVDSLYATVDLCISAATLADRPKEG